ncbi:uncharacterized protein LOC110835270 isoform X2 [Zootermopsis nevadensis]|uniref:uncharacterized protein LOC110835270 isoform X2 n=1 Tax=Zootermopsis nevadensis TaxID=136037 RepID=UPI000B8EDAF7|nr:uncharacterized protein LOC110835270 isoform X2 [Zootermopsis nevadensis]
MDSPSPGDTINMLIVVTVTCLSVIAAQGTSKIEASKKPTWLTSNDINVLDKPAYAPSRRQWLPRQTASHPEIEASDPIGSPFPLFPTFPSFNFPSFVQPIYGTGNYGLLVNRVARLEGEIKLLKQKIVSLDRVLNCANITSSPGFRPASSYAPIRPQGSAPFSGGGYVVSSQSGGPGQSSGVLVSSTYNNQEGSQGQGTLTVEHFGNTPKV